MERTETLFLRPIEAAHALGISRTRVYELLATGKLPAIRLDGRTWRVPRKAIEQLVDEAMKAADKAE